MAEDIEELVVRARPEGIEVVENDLEGLDEQFDETGEGMEDTAGEMSDLSNRWQGAMTAILGGLMVAAGGLFSLVPGLSEIMGGLGAIIRGVAFQIQDTFGPQMSALADFLFGVSDAVFDADGVWGDFVATLAAAIPLVTGLALTIAKLAVIFGSYASTSAALIAGLKAIGAAIATVAGIIGAVPLAIAGVIAGIAVFIFALVTDFKGVRTKILGIWKALIRGLAKISMGIATILIDLAESASDWGSSLIKNFIDGITSKIGALSDTANKIAGVLQRHLEFNSPTETGPLSDFDGTGLTETMATGISSGVGDVESAANQVAGAAKPQGGAGAGNTIVVESKLDGRKVSRGTDPFKIANSQRQFRPGQ